MAAFSEPTGPPFQVNQAAGAVGEADGGVTPSGEYVVVWRSLLTSRVSHRRFSSSGTPLMNEVDVSEDTGAESSPRVAVGPDGGFFVVWYENTTPEIHGRRFSSGGAPLTSEFRVSTNGGVLGVPDVATAPSGMSLAVWRRSGDGSGTGLFGQIFARNGAPIGVEFRVNAATTGEQNVPRVAATGKNGFVVVWEGTQSGSTEILARLFDSAGMPVGGDVPVNSYTADTQFEPSVAADGAGNFTVAWSSYQAGEDSHGVYAQRFASTGVRLGFEFRVNVFTIGSQRWPAVYADSRGRTLVGFVHGDSHTARYREYASDGTPKGFETEFSTPFQSSSNLSIDGLPDGRPVAVWVASATQIAARGLPLTPDPIGAEFRVNTTTTGYQLEPSVAGNPDGSFVVAWAGKHPGVDAFDVWVQRYSPAGAPVGFETLSSNTFYQDRVPSIASDAAGGFVVVWQVSSFAFTGLVHRRYSSTGAALTDIVPVENFPGPADVARSPAGSFVIAWSSAYGTGYAGQEIRARRFASSGVPEGDVFRVNTTTVGAQDSPRVSLDADGDFVVVWTSPSDGSGLGVYAQRFASSGQSLGPEFLVNTQTFGMQDQPDVAAFPDGDFVVTWRSDLTDGSETAIVARRFASSGVPAGSQFLVNSFTTLRQQLPRVAARQDGFAILWRNDVSDYRMKGQLFSKKGTRVDGEFQVAGSEDRGVAAQPQIAFAGTDLVVAWAGDDPAPVLNQNPDVRAQRFRVRLCAAGDANGDGLADVADVFFLINHLFAGGGVPTSCANANGDATTDVADVFYLINYLFAGGAIPI